MTRTVNPELLDDRLRYTLRDMCRVCGVHAGFLMELVEEGVIAPSPAYRRRATRRRAAADTAHGWQFDGVAVVRVQRAVRLQRDLGINLPGVALALQLLDELERLRQQGR
jgi:chaperone modulatory protein CbpM